MHVTQDAIDAMVEGTMQAPTVVFANGDALAAEAIRNARNGEWVRVNNPNIIHQILARDPQLTKKYPGMWLRPPISTAPHAPFWKHAELWASIIWHEVRDW